jgi:hypothetical protein
VKSSPWSFALALLVIGCSSLRVPELGPRYTPANVRAVPALPKSIRRVALLTIAPHREGSVLASGAENLSNIVEVELRKTGVFEVVLVSEHDLQAWTGRRFWRVDEALPQNFLAHVRDETGCDAILFTGLTAFRPYPPLAIGLELRLVNCADHATVWAVDEILDAGSEPVARSARDYARTRIHVREGEESAVLQSPTRFAHFVSATLLGTLPPRENSLKKSQEPAIPRPAE